MEICEPKKTPLTGEFFRLEDSQLFNCDCVVVPLVWNGQQFKHAGYQVGQIHVGNIVCVMVIKTVNRCSWVVQCSLKAGYSQTGSTTRCSGGWVWGGLVCHIVLSKTCDDFLCLLLGSSSSSFLVLKMSHHFEVLGVATQSVVAKMIYLFLTR